MYALKERKRETGKERCACHILCASTSLEVAYRILEHAMISPRCQAFDFVPGYRSVLELRSKTQTETFVRRLVQAGDICVCAFAHTCFA